jgi:hypothetical protein
MSRRKLSGSEGGEHFKLSVILPMDLYRRLEEFRARRDDEMSRVVRELLERALEGEQQEPRGEARGDLRSLTITLRPELFHCVWLAAAYLGMATGDLVQRMLDEHIEEYIQKGEQRIEELRRILEGRGRMPGE